MIAISYLSENKNMSRGLTDVTTTTDDEHWKSDQNNKSGGDIFILYN